MIAIGERFDLIDEGIHGYVDSLVSNGFGDICSAVIRMDDGRWAAVDVRMLQRVSVTLQ